MHDPGQLGRIQLDKSETSSDPTTAGCEMNARNDERWTTLGRHPRYIGCRDGTGMAAGSRSGWVRYEDRGQNTLGEAFEPAPRLLCTEGGDLTIIVDVGLNDALLECDDREMDLGSRMSLMPEKPDRWSEILRTACPLLARWPFMGCFTTGYPGRCECRITKSIAALLMKHGRPADDSR